MVIFIHFIGLCAFTKACQEDLNSRSVEALFRLSGGICWQHDARVEYFSWWDWLGDMEL